MSMESKLQKTIFDSDEADRLVFEIAQLLTLL